MHHYSRDYAESNQIGWVIKHNIRYCGLCNIYVKLFSIETKHCYSERLRALWTLQLCQNDLGANPQERDKIRLSYTRWPFNILTTLGAFSSVLTHLLFQKVFLSINYSAPTQSKIIISLKCHNQSVVNLLSQYNQDLSWL